MEVLVRKWAKNNQNAIRPSGLVAKITLVTDIDQIAASAFDMFGKVHCSNAQFDDLLHVGNGQTVFRRFRTVDLYIDVKALRKPISPLLARKNDCMWIGDASPFRVIHAAIDCRCLSPASPECNERNLIQNESFDLRRKLIENDPTPICDFPRSSTKNQILRMFT
jgi:hypothetical protein